MLADAIGCNHGGEGFFVIALADTDDFIIVLAGVEVGNHFLNGLFDAAAIGVPPFDGRLVLGQSGQRHNGKRSRRGPSERRP